MTKGFRARDGLNSRDVETWPEVFAVEARSADGTRRLGGRAITYGKMSKPLGHFIEQFEARAFAKSIGDGFGGARATLEHQPHQLLAAVDNGSLRFAPTRDALDYDMDLCNTQACRDAWEYVNNGLIRGSSVEFRCHSDSFSYEGGELPIRHIASAQLLGVAITANPAYGLGATDVGIRHLASQLGEDLEDVKALAAQRELRSLFTRTDRQVAAPPTVAPTPLEVAQRTVAETRGETMDISTARAHLESMKPRTGMSAKQANIELYAAKFAWDRPTPAEARQQLNEMRSGWAESDPRCNPRR